METASEENIHFEYYSQHRKTIAWILQSLFKLHAPKKNGCTQLKMYTLLLEIHADETF